MFLDYPRVKDARFKDAALGIAAAEQRQGCIDWGEEAYEQFPYPVRVQQPVAFKGILPSRGSQKRGGGNTTGGVLLVPF